MDIVFTRNAETSSIGLVISGIVNTEKAGTAGEHNPCIYFAYSAIFLCRYN